MDGLLGDVLLDDVYWHNQHNCLCRNAKVKELALCIVVFEPMEALIHQFLHFWSHGDHGEALNSDVVGGDHGAFELWMSHFFKSCANKDCKFANIVECSKFHFGS